jgi:hypothetical protein
LLLLLIVTLAAGALLAESLPSRPARAQTPPPSPNSLTLTMAGPSTAAAGQDATYRLHVSYAPHAFETGLDVTLSCHATLLSERLLFGAPPSLEGRDGDRLYWFGTFSYDTEAEFEINLHIASDFAGTLQLSAEVPQGLPGTTRSNVVETQVTGPGADASCPPVERPTPGPNDPTCGSPAEQGELTVTGRVPTDHGTVTLPELHLTTLITSAGCFEFRHIQLPRSPMLVSVDVEADGYRPIRWANYLILITGTGGPIFTPPLRPGSLPDVFDPCPGLIAHPQTQSAAIQFQASLCEQLLVAPTPVGDHVSLPLTGTGATDEREGQPLAEIALLLACVSLVGACALFAIRSRRA